MDNTPLLLLAHIYDFQVFGNNGGNLVESLWQSFVLGTAPTAALYH
jgi:hypothetical protein